MIAAYEFPSHMDFPGEYGNWKERKKGIGYSTDRIEWEWVENRGNLTKIVVERNAN